MSCRPYTKLEFCEPCIFNYTDGSNEYTIDLSLITETYSKPNGFTLVTSGGKSVFIPNESDFTLEDILSAKCQCSRLIGSGSSTQECSPYSTSYYLTQEGLQPNSEPYNLISIYNPTFCRLNLSIDSGNHVIPDRTSNYELKFDCVLEPNIELSLINPGSLDCDIEDIFVTIIRTK